MRLLLKHCHLVVDEQKEYLDGAILINNEQIEDIFYHSNKVNIEGVQEVNLKGQIVMPAFYSPISKFRYLDPLMENASSIAKKLHENHQVVLIGNTKAYKKDLENIYYDGIYRLYENMTSFHHQKEGLVNLAFEKKEKYVLLDPTHISDKVLQFTLENLRNDRVILLGNGRVNCKRLKEMNIPLTDILQMQSLNYYRLYQEEKRKGTLFKGKYSDIHIYNESMDLLFRFEKGVMIND